MGKEMLIFMKGGTTTDGRTGGGIVVATDGDGGECPTELVAAGEPAVFDQMRTLFAEDGIEEEAVDSNGIERPKEILEAKSKTREKFDELKNEDTKVEDKNTEGNGLIIIEMINLESAGLRRSVRVASQPRRK